MCQHLCSKISGKGGGGGRSSVRFTVLSEVVFCNNVIIITENGYCSGDIHLQSMTVFRSVILLIVIQRQSERVSFIHAKQNFTRNQNTD